jgi:hypothetical protein
MMTPCEASVLSFSAMNSIVNTRIFSNAIASYSFCKGGNPEGVYSMRGAHAIILAESFLANSASVSLVLGASSYTI